MQVQQQQQQNTTRTKAASKAEGNKIPTKNDGAAFWWKRNSLEIREAAHDH